jgi:hypothetical protein
MGLSERIGRLLGRNPAANATLVADRERQQRMHGQEVGQTTNEQANMRQRMEAEMDTQRTDRQQKAGPDA